MGVFSTKSLQGLTLSVAARGEVLLHLVSIRSLRAALMAAPFFLFGGASLAATPADNASQDEPKRTRKGALALVVDNDLFARGSLDRDYSSGIEISYLTAPTQPPQWSERAIDFLARERETLETRFHFGLGHHIYTPEDISLEIPAPNDRPYAGLLYGSVGAVLNQNDTRIDQLQLLFGVVGPASQADSIQIAYHRLINAEDPRGWDNQISNRPAFELSWRRTHIANLVGDSGSPGFKVQFAPHYGARVGNLKTAANLGATVRFGWNPPIDITPATLKPSLPGAALFKPTAKWGWYVYSGVDGRYIPQNIFLDGMPRSNDGVTRRNFTGDVILGLAFYRGPVRVGYTHFVRTRQYDEQNRDGSEYGSFSVAVNF